MRGAQPLGGRLELGPAEVLLLVEHLALEVRLGHRVEIDQPESAHPRRGEIERRRRPETAGADDEHPRRAQPLLSRRADFGQAEMARVTPALPGIEGHGAMVYAARRWPWTTPFA